MQPAWYKKKKQFCERESNTRTGEIKPIIIKMVHVDESDPVGGKFWFIVFMFFLP